MTNTQTTETGTIVITCTECGHLHFTPSGHVDCPIDGCECPYAPCYAVAYAAIRKTAIRKADLAS